MKKSAVAAVLAVAVVAIPVAADAAATYTPISFSSPRGDVSDSGGRRVSVPSIDITGISGHRYAGNFQIKVYFNDLAQTRYVRRLVYLSDDSATDRAKTTILESRVSSDPAKPVTDVVVAYAGSSAVVYKRCPGVHGSVDYRGNTITYTLPTECYVDVNRNAAYLGAFSGQFHQATYRNAPFSPSQPQPDFFDNGTVKYWKWAAAAPAVGRTPAIRPDGARLLTR